MSNPIRLDLPFPPSVNNLFSQSRTGRRFPSKKYVAWRRAADWLLNSQRIKQKPLVGPVTLQIALTPGDKRPRDADNYGKAIIDSLVRARFLPDDSAEHVRGISITWLPADKAASRATITITNASGRGAGALQPELLPPA